MACQRGQGTIEYILILTISVILILSFLWQFNTAFRGYANQLFDGYLACLLETGELPGNGGECGAQFQNFNPADGRAIVAGDPIDKWVSGDYNNNPVGGGPGSGSSGSGSSGSGKNGEGADGEGKDGSSGSDSASNKANNGGGDSGGDSSSGETVAGSSDPSSRAAVGSMRNRRSRASTAVGTAKGTQEESALAGKDALVGVGPGGNNSNGSDAALRAKTTTLDRGYGFMGMEDEEAREAERPPIAQVAKESEGQDSLRPKSAKENLDRGPAAKSNDEEGGTGIGAFVRFILMAGIIIAIIFLFGGQIMQISNAGDK